MRHADKLTPIRPQNPRMRKLVFLVEHRRQLVNDKTRLTNRLNSALKQYYPLALDWFDRKDTIVCCNFLER